MNDSLLLLVLRRRWNYFPLFPIWVFLARRYSLDLLSNSILFSLKIMSCVPSASPHYLNLAKIYNKGGLDFDKKYTRERMDDKKIDYFVDFLNRYASIRRMSAVSANNDRNS